METRTPAATSATRPSAPQGATLRRTCACGQHTPGGGECAGCRKDRELRRASTGPASPGEAPPIVHEVLRSPGQRLDRETRSFMEPRFGQDFSRVRVHTSGKAAESARAVNARAYTVGSDIIFGAGEYSPGAVAGRRLLAHELAHTVQQFRSGSSARPMAQSIEIGEPGDALEAEAEMLSDRIVGEGRILGPSAKVSPAGPVLQRQADSSDPASLLAGTSCQVPSTDPAAGGTSLEVEFALDSSELSPSGRAVLNDFVGRWAAAGANASVEVHGFASQDGPADYNLKLSCRRAEAVAAELSRPELSQFIPGTMIANYAHGETAEFGEEAANRRVLVTANLPVGPSPIPPTPPSPTPPSPTPARPIPKSIEFWYHAFIPKTVRGARPAPGGPFAGRTVFPSPTPVPFVLDPCFETDERGFDPSPGASSRLRADVTLDTASRSLTVTPGADLTFEIDCSTGKLRCAKMPSPSVSVSMIPAFLSPSGVILIAMINSASDPGVTPAPDLTIRGLIAVDLGARTFTFTGATTFYPAFEMYASFDGGPTAVVFTQPPIVDNPLILGAPGVKSITGSVPF